MNITFLCKTRPTSSKCSIGYMSLLHSILLCGLITLLECSTLEANEEMPLTTPAKAGLVPELQSKPTLSVEQYQPEYSSLRERIKNVWHSPGWIAILPVNTYHSRNTYDKDSIDDYNEMPWGAGIGKWYRDKNNTRHQIMFITFSDSNYKPQPTLSYTWQKDLFLDRQQNWIFGYGCDFFLTMRHEAYYLPLPAFTPQMSFQYKNLAVVCSWVPWLGPDYGNVLMTTLRWYF